MTYLMAFPSSFSHEVILGMGGWQQTNGLSLGSLFGGL
jgi:hypothetical protein